MRVTRAKFFNFVNYVVSTTLLSCGSDNLTSLKNPFSIELLYDAPVVENSVTCHPVPTRTDIAEANESPEYQYTWLRADSENGAFNKIENESQSSLILTSAVAHKYIKCIVKSEVATGENTEATSDIVFVEDSPPTGSDVEFFGSTLADFNVYFALNESVSDKDGDPVTSVSTQNISGGALSSWSCNDGLCTAKFTPSGLSDGQTIFEYKVSNEYGTMETWSKAKFKLSAGGQ